MRVSLEERRLRFFWLEAETNLCAQGSGLCGGAGEPSRAVPTPQGAWGGPGAAPALVACPALRLEGFTPSPASWLPPGSRSERAAGSGAMTRSQRGGCHRGNEEVAVAVRRRLQRGGCHRGNEEVSVRRLQRGGCLRGNEEVADAAAQLLICMSAYVGQLVCRPAFLPGATSSQGHPRV